MGGGKSARYFEFWGEEKGCGLLRCFRFWGGWEEVFKGNFDIIVVLGWVYVWFSFFLGFGRSRRVEMIRRYSIF